MPTPDPDFDAVPEPSADLAAGLASEPITELAAPLYSPRTVRELLERFNLRPTKSLGQNFLIDGNTLRLIAEVGGAAQGVNVLEVGPGLGVLTRELARRGAAVTTLEKDERLRPVLAETLAGSGVDIIWGDALTFDYSQLPPGTRVIANLPYYISTALLTQFMQAPGIVSATVLVQREVAERLGAQPGQDGYGYLSALVALHGSAKIIRDVSKGAFFPAPDVTSSIVRLEFSGSKPDPAFVRFLEVALQHRRKTLRNNLRMAGYEGEFIDAAIQKAGQAGPQLTANVRAEDVPLVQMEQIFTALRPVDNVD
ncbi:16S rRNA (adenine(1518)-N(6)/adenine(1519)-N(6))-dimethyltransferase RsmA [Deinococcus detaillensis]|uniref:Ribosomal RNA small subunit methyltransferase A n=1 Tax=Deinococcus detaillensis TaxID=2592048 RepID=A0A553UN24_9DEIO|nr:16S rRNA (adenine(1518)-N(6)/adenine(1519)-N(6))-dimethyltransferase RsmA [Deinococcus detaillensis]TSA81371.1 16S rRNA (adenine(1518)-N(6)/adenine(1519)-N(6))-dimethyltransferase RsmA [Deinococcus detaillensis]